jgi:hypothetical protein
MNVLNLISQRLDTICQIKPKRATVHFLVFLGQLNTAIGHFSLRSGEAAFRSVGLCLSMHGDRSSMASPVEMEDGEKLLLQPTGTPTARWKWKMERSYSYSLLVLGLFSWEIFFLGSATGLFFVLFVNLYPIIN